MDKVGTVLLAIMGMLAWMALLIGAPIAGWSLILRLVVAVQVVATAIISHVRNTYTRCRLWLKMPRNEAQALRLLTWVGAIVFAGAAWLAWAIDSESELGGFRTEATGIAIAVVFIEEISRRRAYLERKQEIIQQMGSRSNNFALEAARIAHSERWLIDGSFRYAHLWEANLQDAFLGMADLEGSRLGIANLQHATLVGANLQYAFMLRVDLRDAELQLANLQGAHLPESNVQGANLLGANLQGANLFGANLQGALLREAKFDSETIWPEGFDPAAHGAVRVDA